MTASMVGVGVGVGVEPINHGGRRHEDHCSGWSGVHLLSWQFCPIGFIWDTRMATLI